MSINYSNIGNADHPSRIKRSSLLTPPVLAPVEAMSTRKTSRSLSLALIAIASAAFFPTAVQAVPSFARQTGMACIACHSEFPILTEFGRQFKLGGYTLSTNQTDLPPLAMMFTPSFTHTDKGQPGGAAPGYRNNNNFALNQASVFYNGRLFGPYAESLFGPSTADFLNHIGTFIQTTYDGVGHKWAWDNVEIRYANTGTIADQSLAWGVYLNNNPSLQDPWNTAPAWSYPFSGSSLGPSPGAATLIDGGLSQQVMGFGAYAMIANTVYLDVGAYHTLGTGFQKSLGVDPTGETQVSDLAPYWRAAYTKSFGSQSLEFGLIGLAANTYPGRDKSAGKDHMVDWGLDSQYQVSMGNHDITGLLSWIYETDRFNASQTLGGASNRTDHLWTGKAAIDYLYDKTYGGAVGYFTVNGSKDAAWHSESLTGSPKSDGLVFQLNYLPFNKGGGPAFWPKSNVKLSLQYVMYNRFDGAHSNYDGTGRNARDNNTLYLEAWIAF